MYVGMYGCILTKLFDEAMSTLCCKLQSKWYTDSSTVTVFSNTTWVSLDTQYCIIEEIINGACKACNVKVV